MADFDFTPASSDDAGASLPAPVGPRLKAARQAAGLTMADVCEITKIPTRMLDLLEAGDFASLPARTYATGFTRTYAKAVGLDPNEIVAAVRVELGMNGPTDGGLVPAFEPGDPARVPTARFAWLAGLIAVGGIIFGLFFWHTYYAPAVTLPSLLPDEAETASAVPQVEAEPAGVPSEAASDAMGVVPGDAASAGPAAFPPAVPAANVTPTAVRRPQARRQGHHNTGAHLPAGVASPAVPAPPVVAPPPASTVTN